MSLNFEQLKMNTLRFLDQCYPSEGVFDAEGWEASGEHFISTAASQKFIKKDSDIVVVAKTFAERMRDNDWRFASTPGGCESFEASHSALETYYFYGMIDKLSDENKKAWADYLNSFQDPETGYYLGPYIRPENHPCWKDYATCTHPWRHMHDHLVSSVCPTLMLLGPDIRSKYKLSEGSMTGRFLDQKVLEEYLYGHDWNNYTGDGNYRRHNPWWMGNEFWFPGCILWQIAVWEKGTPAGDQAERLLNEVWFKWHDDNFGKTGFWYGDLDGDPEKLWHGELPVGFSCRTAETEKEHYWVMCPIMGAAHQLWVYDYLHHPIPDEVRKAQTDNLLALQNIYDDHFGLAAPFAKDSKTCNCSEVDCMTLLANNYYRQDYRRKDIEEALLKGAKAMLRDRIGKGGVLVSSTTEPFTHHNASYETYSRAGDANVIDQSFYLWALRAAANVVKKCDDPDIESILSHPWPNSVSHWLWLPENGIIK